MAALEFEYACGIAPASVVGWHHNARPRLDNLSKSQATASEFAGWPVLVARIDRGHFIFHHVLFAGSLTRACRVSYTWMVRSWRSRLCMRSQN